MCCAVLNKFVATGSIYGINYVDVLGNAIENKNSIWATFASHVLQSLRPISYSLAYVFIIPVCMSCASVVCHLFCLCVCFYLYIHRTSVFYVVFMCCLWHNKWWQWWQVSKDKHIPLTRSVPSSLPLQSSWGPRRAMSHAFTNVWWPRYLRTRSPTCTSHIARFLSVAHVTIW